MMNRIQFNNYIFLCDHRGKALEKFFIPSHDAKTKFSFLGVRFTNCKRIRKVTVTHDSFLAEGLTDISQGGTKDLVVLDNFIYGEPIAE